MTAALLHLGLSLIGSRLLRGGRSTPGSRAAAGLRQQGTRSQHRRQNQSLHSCISFGGCIRSPLQLHHASRSEEHTSELQSLTNLVCRLLLEKKKLRELGARSHAQRAIDREDGYF